MKTFIKKVIRKLPIPEYSIVPIVSMLVINVLTYNVSRLITTGMTHYDLTTPLDTALPFVPFFMWIYVFLAYFQWIFGFIMVAKEKKETGNYIFSAEIIAKLITLFFFLVLPTIIARPSAEGPGLSNLCCRIVYATDGADNCFPSVHCLESWILFRATFRMERTGKKYQWFMFITTILICLSTVLVKQHFVVDVFGAIAAVEIGLLVARKFTFTKIFDAFRRLFRVEGYV